MGCSCWSLGPFLLCPLFVLSGSGSGGVFRGGELEGEIVVFLDLVLRGDGLGWVGVKYCVISWTVFFLGVSLFIYTPLAFTVSFQTNGSKVQDL